MPVEEFSAIDVRTWLERTTVVVATVYEKHVLGKNERSNLFY